MALLTCSSSSPPPLFHNSIETTRPRNSNSSRLSVSNLRSSRSHSVCRGTRIRSSSIVTCQLCAQETLTLDRSVVNVEEAYSEDELWAAACLRVRTFFISQQEPHEIYDHMKYLAEREFEALKERIAGKREGFKRVSCINATVPLSRISNYSDELCSIYKIKAWTFFQLMLSEVFGGLVAGLVDKDQYSDNGEDRVVIGSLDLNQCLRLPDEITGKRPEGVGSDLARAYLSNVCVAKELQKNGVGSSLVVMSKKVAQNWGITDLYVHVAVDNEPARRLYIKSGFIYENDEPAWQARFLDRPRRILLWTDVSDGSIS